MRAEPQGHVYPGRHNNLQDAQRYQKQALSKSATDLDLIEYILLHLRHTMRSLKQLKGGYTLVIP